MGWIFQQKPPMGWPLDYDSGLADFVGAWFMREGAGNKVYDSSENGNTGTLSGNTIGWVPGKFGSVINFTDDDIINLGNNSSLHLTRDFTISFWIYKKGNQPNTHTYLFLKRVSGGDARIAILLFDHSRLWNWDELDSGLDLNNNQWYHIVYVAETTSPTAGTETFYADGVYLNSITGAMDTANTAHDLTIGNPLDLIYSLNGLIDNVLIYNRALSASEIAELYRYPFWMFKDPAEVALLGGYQVAVGTILPQITSAYMRI